LREERQVDALKGVNLGLALILELAMLLALALWAESLSLDLWLRWAVAAVLVIAAMTAWAIWGAPRSQRRLAGPALLAFKMTMFGLASLALWAAGQGWWAALFAVLAATNLALAQVWRQE
jgi:hypothetical protein